MDVAATAMTLALLAVAPGRQDQGVGSRLLADRLAELDASGYL